MATDIGVAILLSPEAEEAAYRLAADQGSRTPLEFALTRDHFPHITLYQGRFMQGKLEARWVKEFTRRARRTLTLQLGTRLSPQANGNVFWLIKEDAALTDLHITAAEYLQGKTLLLLPRPEVIWNDRATPRDVRERIIRLGNDRAGKFDYLPHVTSGRISSAHGGDAGFQTMSVPPMGFAAKRIIIGEIDEYGRMARDRVHEVLEIG